jgi:hypothetical protein
MKSPIITIGISPLTTKKRELEGLGPFREHIYDLHFPHYNPHISASGRAIDPKISVYEARKRTLALIDWNQKHSGFKLTLLLNYLLHDNYKVVVDNVVKELYPRGVRSFVVADLELIKRLKDALPDCEIQGSCLSHRMTEEELDEERREGVVMHNPSVNIIRNPVQLKRNHEAGFPQKIIAFEGCLHNCPDEDSQYGHRWYLARSIYQGDYYCSDPAIALDPPAFFKANWVTVSRLKTLLPYISVVKLPRKRKMPLLDTVKRFMHLFETGDSYNVTDFISSGYYNLINREIGAIPSHLFNDAFFETVENCKMNCSEMGCYLCYEMMDNIKQVNGGPIRPGLLKKAYRHLIDRVRRL